MMSDGNVPPSVAECNQKPVVFLDGSVSRTNSLDVASYFGKRHDHVTRDIRNLIEAAGSEHAPNFGEMFKASNRVIVAGNGAKRLCPCYDMTRDGFTLLAVGFTGSKAFRFKIGYIDAFNEMESTLKAIAPDHSIPAEPAEPALDTSENDNLKLRKVTVVRGIFGNRAARQMYIKQRLETVPAMFEAMRQGDLLDQSDTPDQPDMFALAKKPGSYPPGNA
jgi:Rha family phage regulatory protein